MNIRTGLIKGRVRMRNKAQESSTVIPSFGRALDAATMEDLQWAMNLLITRPNSQRTYRDHRMKMISRKMIEKLHER